MIEVGLQELLTRPPSRQTITEWVMKSLTSLPTSLVRASWRHAPYSYFPNEQPEVGLEEPPLEEREVVDFSQAFEGLQVYETI